MAIALFKSTIFMEGVSHGWTESYWQETPSDDYEAAMDNLKALGRARAKILGKECRVKALRVSIETVLGDSLLEYVNYKGVAQKDTAAPEVCVLLRLRDATRSRSKNVFLRGIWDDVESDNGDYKRNTPVWRDNMDNFLKFFSTPQGIWGWLGVATKTKANLTNYVVLTDNRLRFTFASDIFPIGLVGKQVQVRLQGVNGQSNLNGLQVVVVESTTVAVTYQPISHVPYVFGGRGTYYTKAFIRSLWPKDEKISERKPGAPLLESPGHAKKRSRT